MKVGKTRLLINGIFSACIAALFLPLLLAGLQKLFDSEPYPASWDSDQVGAARTALAAYLAGGVFGLVGLVSLIKTIIRWRSLGKEKQTKETAAGVNSH